MKSYSTISYKDRDSIKTGNVGSYNCIQCGIDFCWLRLFVSLTSLARAEDISLLTLMRKSKASYCLALAKKFLCDGKRYSYQKTDSRLYNVVTVLLFNSTTIQFYYYDQDHSWWHYIPSKCSSLPKKYFFSFTNVVNIFYTAITYTFHLHFQQQLGCEHEVQF